MIKSLKILGYFLIGLIQAQLTAGNVLAQLDTSVDSLQNIVETGPDDTNKVIALQRLCFTYRGTDTIKSFDYGKQGIELAKKLDFKRGLALVYNNIATTYAITGNNQKAIEYLNMSFDISEEIGNKHNSASALNNLGIIYQNHSDYLRSLSYYLKALRIYEELNNNWQINRCLNNIGALYYYTGDYDLSLKYHNRSLEIKKKENDKEGLAGSYCNIAIVFKKQFKYDSALYYQNIALKLRQEANYKRGVANSHENIGCLYISTGDFKIAEEQLLSAYDMYIEMGLEADLGNIYNNLGTVSQNLGNITKARDYYLKGLEAGVRNNFPELQKAANLGLSETYAELGDFRNAYDAHYRYKALSDSLLDKDNIQKLTELEMQHQFEQQLKHDSIERAEKERTLKIERRLKEQAREEELKKQKIFTFSVIIVALLLAGMSFILIRRNKEKQRANSIITAQKLEVEEQKVLLEEKNLQITDSINYSKRIQSALLASEKEFSNRLPDSFMLYIPKDIISGDFYWIEPSGDDILFGVADCTGHGVPGALVSIIGLNSLNRVVKEFGLTKPSLMLDKLNVLVEEAFEKSESEILDGMDIALCKLDKKNGKLEYSGANNPLYIIRQKDDPDDPLELIEIKADKQPIGSYSYRKQFTNHVVDLMPGDSIYLFSDGYADQFGGPTPNGKKLKYKQFKNILLEGYHKSADENKQLLIDSFNDWKMKHEQVDDICIAMVKI